MNDLMKFLAEADGAALRLERARRAMDVAKTQLENAKQAYDEILARSDEMGISRAKLKKVTDERIAALIESGMVEFEKAGNEPRLTDGKVEKPKPRPRVKSPTQELSEETAATPQVASLALPETIPEVHESGLSL